MGPSFGGRTTRLRRRALQSSGPHEPQFYAAAMPCAMKTMGIVGRCSWRVTSSALRLQTAKGGCQPAANASRAN